MPEQSAIRRWFDHTYATRGLDYLRPSDFYAVFPAYLEVAPGERLLDLGCGPGLLLAEARRAGAEVWGVDVSTTALALARRDVPAAHLAVASAETLPFADHSFHHLTCIGVFEHILDPVAALAEMRRVLVPGGRLCVMVPNSLTVKWQLEANVFRVHHPDSNERAATLTTWRRVFADWTLDRIERDDWPAYTRRLTRRPDDFATWATRRRRRPHLPLGFANQFVFLLRA